MSLAARRAERDRLAAAQDRLFGLLDEAHAQVRAYQDTLLMVTRRYDSLTNRIFNEENDHERIGTGGIGGSGNSGGQNGGTDEPGRIQVS